MSTTADVHEPPVAAKQAVEEYAAPEVVKQQTLLKDWAAERAKFQADPDKFWDAVAREFAWTKPWTKVCEWDGSAVLPPPSQRAYLLWVAMSRRNHTMLRGQNQTHRVNPFTFPIERVVRRF